MRLESDGTAIPTGNVMMAIREGMQYAFHNRRVTTLTAIVTVQSLLALPYVSLLPIFAGDVLQVGPQGLGVLTGATGIGALAGAASLMRFGDLPRRGRLLIAGMLGFTSLLAVFALSKWLVLSLVALTIVGWGQVMHLTMTNTLIQLSVPDSLRGRVLGLYFWLHVGLLPLGALLLGAAAQQWGAPAALLVSVSIYGLICLLVLWQRPDMFSWE
jgi:hypothetical protein